MHVFLWRAAYLAVGVVHLVGVTSCKLADRLDSMLTDQFRKVR